MDRTSATPAPDPRAELERLHATLVDLATWADDQMNEDADRQYIAEYLTDALTALHQGRRVPVAPF